MTVMRSEMQKPEIIDFFRLEIAIHLHQQQTPDDLLNFVMGTQCQKI